jgi:tRNA dimethylallyltransferase
MIRALAITGPTASGKTAISIALAEELGCEIISCDSMQIYKDMNVGTAKVTKEEASGIPHHLIDIIDPSEAFSVEDYRTRALAAAGEIVSRGKIPMFVGGTGLYVDALMRAPMTNVPESSIAYREKILSEIKNDQDVEALWQRLNAIDSLSAAAIHKNNVRRVIRALEIYEVTGKTKSEIDRASKEASPDISIGMITLDFHDRDTLYKRVDMRVDAMMREGLLEEVKELYDSGRLPENSTAAQAIGYKEIIKHLEGKISLAEAVEDIKLATRRYAKRQLTWFRHNEAKRLYIDGEDGKMRDTEEIIAEAKAYACELMNL